MCVGGGGRGAHEEHWQKQVKGEKSLSLILTTSPQNEIEEPVAT